MSTAAQQRRERVLRAIVADYISSQEPVGSKALVERHQLGVSPATIRNDMAVLETEGYIVQQHASSGRIPTQKAYRAFVDSIHDIKPLSRAERTAMLRFLDEGVDLEDVLRRSVQLLGQLTHQAAVVQLPSLGVSRVKHCEVVALTPTRLLLVLITDTGRVDQRNVELGEPVGDSAQARLREVLGAALHGRTLRDASVSIDHLAENAPADIRDATVRCCTVLKDTLVEGPSERFIVAGASNLSRIPKDFPAILEALEEQVVVLKLLSSAGQLGEVQVRIGEELDYEELAGVEGLRSTSVVTTGYGQEGAIFGGMGVVGPTYMDYSGTISKVSAVAHYVSRVLAGH